MLVLPLVVNHFKFYQKIIKLTLNDKSKNRIQILKSNLNRLNFNAKILNKDFTKFEEKKNMIL